MDFKWGILGLGTIAHKFARDVTASDGLCVHAVASRDIDKANAFGDAYGAPLRYGSYEALCAADVDAVYIATPHPLHMPNALLCIDAGKPVLVEKPFAVTLDETRAIIDAARARNVFCMEAHWTRFLPVIRAAHDWVADGRIGDLRLLQCDFAFRAGMDPDSRIMANRYAGGGILDVGCYTLSVAGMFCGDTEEQLCGMAHIGETNVDEQASMMLKYRGGAMAMLFCGVRTNTLHDLRIYGTEGRIHVPDFWHASQATLHVGHAVETAAGLERGGYQYEAYEVMRCVREGRLESECMTWQQTLEIARQSQQLRDLWGLQFDTSSLTQSTSSIQ